MSSRRVKKEHKHVPTQSAEDEQDVSTEEILAILKQEAQGPLQRGTSGRPMHQHSGATKKPSKSHKTNASAAQGVSAGDRKKTGAASTCPHDLSDSSDSDQDDDEEDESLVSETSATNDKPLSKTARKRRNHKANQRARQQAAQTARLTEETFHLALLQEIDNWLKRDQKACLAVQAWLMTQGGLRKGAKEEGLQVVLGWQRRMQERRIKVSKWLAAAGASKQKSA